MRIFLNLLYIALFVLGILIFLYVLGHALSLMDREGSRIIEDLAVRVGANVSGLDVKRPLEPLITGLNYALIIGFLAAVFAVFLQARRGD